MLHTKIYQITFAEAQMMVTDKGDQRKVRWPEDESREEGAFPEMEKASKGLGYHDRGTKKQITLAAMEGL